MDSDETIKYFQFPLYMLRGLFSDKHKTLNNILNFGIWHYAQKIIYNVDVAASLVLYEYYRGDHTIWAVKLVEDLFSNGILTEDEDYNGFNGKGEFDPEQNSGISELTGIYDDYPGLEDEIRKFFQVKTAAKKMGIVIKNFESIEKMEATPIPEKEPQPMVNIDLLFKYRDENKTPDDLFVFAAYVSIGSILGEKDWVKTNKNMIFARALGYRQLPDELPEICKKYFHRYHFERLQEKLSENFGLHFYGYRVKGVYIGKGGKISRKNLIAIAEERKPSNKRKLAKMRTKELREEVLKELKIK